MIQSKVLFKVILKTCVRSTMMTLGQIKQYAVYIDLNYHWNQRGFNSGSLNPNSTALPSELTLLIIKSRLTDTMPTCSFACSTKVRSWTVVLSRPDDVIAAICDVTAAADDLLHQILSNRSSWHSPTPQHCKTFLSIWNFLIIWYCFTKRDGTLG